MSQTFFGERFSQLEFSLSPFITLDHFYFPRWQRRKEPQLNRRSSTPGSIALHLLSVAGAVAAGTYSLHSDVTPASHQYQPQKTSHNAMSRHIGTSLILGPTHLSTTTGFFSSLACLLVPYFEGPLWGRFSAFCCGSVQPGGISYAAMADWVW